MVTKYSGVGKNEKFLMLHTMLRIVYIYGKPSMQMVIIYESEIHLRISEIH